MSSPRILVVAAHPDDEVLGCGGTIAMHRRRGNPVRVIFLAEGVTARYRPEEFGSAAVCAAIQTRHDNALKALAILGIPADAVFLADRPCCRLDQVPLIDLVKQIEAHIVEFQPTHIYTHAADDPNIDHGLALKAVLAAARPIRQPLLQGLYSFEIPSSTEWNTLRPFGPTAFVDIGDTLDLKIEAMRAYGDEMRPAPHPRSDEVLRALACVRGSQCGVHYAEGFVLVRSLEQP